MATYFHIRLPYFAPAPVQLPTYEEVITQENQAAFELIPRRLERRVVKFGDHFVVKYGKKINLIEGKNILIIKEYTKMPIPKLYAMYQHEPSGNKVMIMEYVPGRLLGKCYDSLDDEQKASVGVQLRRHLSDMRKIPSPGVYGLPGCRPYLAQPHIFKRRTGPFEIPAEFFEAYLSAQFPEAGKLRYPQIEELKLQFLELSRGHGKPVFTHGNLHDRNIVLRDDGLICILDWESASFFPEYFEFLVYETYRITSAGASKSDGDKNHILKYAKMVEVFTKLWDTCRYLTE
ncbi:kinase-like domain-containing protein [Xylaria digitata]|nr:kinase-like domain-containing protein [Xylaria digitata]